MPTAFHALPWDKVLKTLRTSTKGLSEEEAKRRLEKYGLNELKERKRKTALDIFIEQFEDPMVVMLIIAAIISFLLGEEIDALVIMAIVVFNGVLGFIQEFRASKAIEALRKLATPRAKVIREGKVLEIDSRFLVPGDIIILNAGDRVPADARLIEAFTLKVQEAALTGESVPVTKCVEPVPESAVVAERKNMVFMGTFVTFGRAKAVVTATGMNTELGKITEMVQVEKEKKTTLEVELEKLSKWLGMIIIAVTALVFVIYYVEEAVPVLEAFMVAVALAVSAVPEGLPAVVTITLALGVREMAKRNAIVRRLASVETLGAVSVICTDKTGTLTQNQMTVRKIWFSFNEYDVSGVGYAPEGEITCKGKKCGEELEILMRIAALCNDAKLEFDEKEGWKIIGDPTEGCLLPLVRKAGFHEDDFAKKWPQVAEISFDSIRKRMSTIHKAKGELHAYVKGAPEVILELSTHILEKGKVRKITEKDKKEILKVYESWAKSAFRALAFAYRSLPENFKDFTPKGVERDLIFVGMVAMIDPPRPEAKKAVEKCRSAGIRVVMVTGDHKDTAVAIAKEVGIFKEGDLVLTGSELEKMDEEELAKIVEKVTVYARVSPEHKVKILKAWQSRGHIVAMTGDGVNDAPALKLADVGVAMGITGTDVAKETADIVLLDDNFATIVAAVEKGRAIYDNVKKFVVFLLESNFDEVALVTTTSLLRMPAPLTAAQILWINLLTDGFPAVALAVDPPAKDIMERPPRDPKKSMIGGLAWAIIIIAVGQYITSAYVYFTEMALHGDVTLARTATFTAAVVFELLASLIVRTLNKNIWEEPLFANKKLWLAILVSLALQFAVVYWPPLQQAFHTTSLSLDDWARILWLPFLSIAFVEVAKVVRKWWLRRQGFEAV